ncbi:MAG: glycoside hydrolase family 52 protein [Planctomycetota bacterium]
MANTLPTHPFFNVQHSPIGAFASFTLGQKGPNGGLGIQQGKPADEPVYIGLESRDDANRFDALPFYDGRTSDEAERYVSENNLSPKMDDHMLGGIPGVETYLFDDEQISRNLTAARDTWTAGDLTFRIITPVFAVPDAEAESPDHDALRLATCPAVLVELEVDNTACDRARRFFFGFSGSDPYSALRQIEPEDNEGIRGLVQGQIKGLFAEGQGIHGGRAFGIEPIIRPWRGEGNDRFGLGPVGLLFGDAPAGKKTTFRFAVCFYSPGVVTTGQDAVYFYTRYFDGLESVGRYALEHFDDYLAKADAADAMLDDAAHLNDAQRFQIAHTIHSYYGSTEFLDLGTAPPLTHDGRTPCWVVNEGEYRMMNTFDLTVDMLFYELRMNPWTSRNVLDRFIDRYSYTDQLHFPGGSNDHPGGVSFTHDQGVTNHFTAAGYSSYEVTGLRGCFSYMTCEQLVNFICCVAAYDHATGDHAWTAKHAGLLGDCLDSLLNRDHPDAAQRNGVMGLDSSRTGNGSEITTYDSLDASLGQARNNVYLAVKSWAGCVLLAKLFERFGQSDKAALAGEQAERTAATIVSQADTDGLIPAVIVEGSVAHIIPAIEGLVFPFVAGAREAVASDGPYAELIAALGKHLDAVLRPGVCLFEDGGWKLSNTSINSWLSKIYLCQFVAREVLGHHDAQASQAADEAHAGWLLRPENTYWAWSDQMHAGVAKGSKYYPRGVTSALWLDEAGNA